MNIKFEIIATINIIFGLVAGSIYGNYVENMSITKYIIVTLIFSIMTVLFLFWIEYYFMKMVKKIYRYFTLRKEL